MYLGVVPNNFVSFFPLQFIAITYRFHINIIHFIDWGCKWGMKKDSHSKVQDYSS